MVLSLDAPNGAGNLFSEKEKSSLRILLEPWIVPWTVDVWISKLRIINKVNGYGSAMVSVVPLIRRAAGLDKPRYQHLLAPFRRKPARAEGGLEVRVWLAHQRRLVRGSPC